MSEEQAAYLPTTTPKMNSLAPQNIAEAMTFCEFLSKSTILPTAYTGKPANVFVAVQWGMEVGLAPLQALQNIAVINGKPSIYGDAALALCKSNRLCEYVVESIEGDGDKAIAVCKVKRKGEPEQERRFSMDDAKKAKLTGKQGPWSEYPKRMLQMRARGFALRDIFPDVLRGMITAEEAQDYPSQPVDITPPKPALPPPATRTEALKQSIKKPDTISRDQAGQIMSNLEQGSIAVAKLFEAFNITRLSELKITQMDDVNDWIAGNAVITDVVDEPPVSPSIDEYNALLQDVYGALADLFETSGEYADDAVDRLTNHKYGDQTALEGAPANYLKDLMISINKELGK
jgi:hypothetical protein